MAWSIVGRLLAGPVPAAGARGGDNPPIEEPDATQPSQRSHAGPLGWVLRLAAWIVPEENASGVVYGVILVGTLLAADSAIHETYADAVGSAAIAAGLYWLAHAYATVLGRRLSKQERLTPGALWRALVHDSALMRGAAIPLLALLVAWVTRASQATGVNAALWVDVAALVLFELVAGLRSQGTRAELALDLCVGVALGLGILALRIVLH